MIDNLEYIDQCISRGTVAFELLGLPTDKSLCLYTYGEERSFAWIPFLKRPKFQAVLNDTLDCRTIAFYASIPFKLDLDKNYTLAQNHIEERYIFNQISEFRGEINGKEHYTTFIKANQKGLEGIARKPFDSSIKDLAAERWDELVGPLDLSRDSTLDQYDKFKGSAEFVCVLQEFFKVNQPF